MVASPFRIPASDLWLYCFHLANFIPYILIVRVLRKPTLTIESCGWMCFEKAISTSTRLSNA